MKRNREDKEFGKPTNLRNLEIAETLMKNFGNEKREKRKPLKMGLVRETKSQPLKIKRAGRCIERRFTPSSG